MSPSVAKVQHLTSCYDAGMHRDDQVTCRKSALRAPATSLLVWREYRARLIQVLRAAARPVQSIPCLLLRTRHYQGSSVIGFLKRKECCLLPSFAFLSVAEHKQLLCRPLTVVVLQAETPVWMRRASQHSGVWAHPIGQLEKGCLLVEVPKKSRFPFHSLASFRSGSCSLLFVVPAPECDRLPN